MHGNEESDVKPVYELTCAFGISVADASVYGEHHYVEAPADFTYVLQFSEIEFFFLSGVDIDVKIRTVYVLPGIVFRQVMCIPVVEVACMENPSVIRLYNP